MMRRFMLPSEVGNCNANLKGSRYRLLVVPLVHPAPEQPAAKRSQPSEDVIHVAEVHHFDEVAIEISDKKEGVPTRRALRPADALHAFGDQVVVPALQVPDIKGNVRQAYTVPRNRDGRLLRLEFKDLQDAAARYANPSDLARWSVRRNLKERTHAV